VEIIFSNNFVRRLSSLKKRNKKLIDRFQNKLEIFKDNPRHNSLRLHKLEGNFGNYWSMSIDRKIRVVFRFDEINNVCYFVDIGNHDEVYRK